MASTTPSFQTNLMNIQSNLLNFAYMLTSNRDDAYDLLQDTPSLSTTIAAACAPQQ